MYSTEYLNMMNSWLNARRSSKIEIIRRGGIKASVHSPGDITMIDFALKRLESGQFGLCADCGSIIEEKRLQFRPETPFCSQCKKDIDEQKKSTPVH